VHGEAPGTIHEAVGLEALDDLAVVILGQHPGDGALEVEAFFENQ